MSKRLALIISLALLLGGVLSSKALGYICISGRYS